MFLTLHNVFNFSKSSGLSVNVANTLYLEPLCQTNWKLLSHFPSHSYQDCIFPDKIFVSLVFRLETNYVHYFISSELSVNVANTLYLAFMSNKLEAAFTLLLTLLPRDGIFPDKISVVDTKQARFFLSTPQWFCSHFIVQCEKSVYFCSQDVKWTLG